MKVEKKQLNDEHRENLRTQLLARAMGERILQMNHLENGIKFYIWSSSSSSVIVSGESNAILNLAFDNDDRDQNDEEFSHN